MNAQELKIEIIEDLKHQLFKKRTRHNWTSLDWYYRNPFYDAPEPVVSQAIDELVNEGKIKLRLQQWPGERAFVVVELIPND